MLAQIVDADPGVFEAFVLIALILMLVAVVLTIVQNGAAALVSLIAWCAFIASFLWLT